jgi:hypothetical protein
MVDSCDYSTIFRSRPGVVVDCRVRNDHHRAARVEYQNLGGEDTTAVRHFLSDGPTDDHHGPHARRYWDADDAHRWGARRVALGYRRRVAQIDLPCRDGCRHVRGGVDLHEMHQYRLDQYDVLRRHVASALNYSLRRRVANGDADSNLGHPHCATLPLDAIPRYCAVRQIAQPPKDGRFRRRDEEWDLLEAPCNATKACRSNNRVTQRLNVVPCRDE